MPPYPELETEVVETVTPVEQAPPVEAPVVAPVATPPAPVIAPVVPPVEAPPESSVAVEKLDRYVAQFGAENAVKWLKEGKSYEDGLVAQNAILSAENATLAGKLVEAENRLKIVAEAGDDPVSHVTAGDRKAAANKAPGRFWRRDEEVD